jgi:hypothetical protein
VTTARRFTVRFEQLGDTEQMVAPQMPNTDRTGLPCRGFKPRAGVAYEVDATPSGEHLAILTPTDAEIHRDPSIWSVPAENSSAVTVLEVVAVANNSENVPQTGGAGDPLSEDEIEELAAILSAFSSADEVSTDAAKAADQARDRFENENSSKRSFVRLKFANASQRRRSVCRSSAIQILKNEREDHERLRLRANLATACGRLIASNK